MKKTLVLSCFYFLAFSAMAQKTTLTVNSTFIGIEQGYDHEFKTQVFINGRLIGESASARQSKGHTFALVNVPTGQNTLKIVALALYEGEWEEHLIENNYSIDCLYETTYTFKKPSKLYLLYDLDQGTRVSWKKPVKR